MSVSPCDREGPWHSTSTPERSPIYALPALGEDRGEPECLTSYLQRLSFKHNLFCGDFVNDILLPRVSAKIKTKSLRLCKVSHSFNGAGIYAREFAQALSEIWPNHSLPKPATFTFLAPLLGDMPRRLVSEYLQWCPQCMKEKDECCFPLYWQSALTSCCRKHQSLLVNRCHQCGKGIRQIVSIGYPGICPYCGAKLEDAEVTPATKEKLYSAEQIRLLIQNRRNLESTNINRNWKSFIHALAAKSGNISKLEATLGLCDTQLSQWLRRSRPELSGIIKLSKSLHIDVVDILKVQTQDNSFSNIVPIQYTRATTCHKRSKQEVEDIRLRIRAYIDNGVSHSMKSAAKYAGVSIGFIDYHFPELAIELKALAKKEIRKNKSQLQTNLRKAISDEVQSYYEINRVFPSVNQVKEALSTTPGNSAISLAHLALAKNSIKLRFPQYLGSFSGSVSSDHNHESNN